MILKTLNVMTHGPRLRALVLVAAAAVCVHCGDNPASPVNPPTPTPTPVAPAPTPTPAALGCSPTPPPIYGMRLAVLDGGSYRKLLKATPLVINTDEYCGRVGFDANQWYCETRPSWDPLRVACDQAAVGRAADTRRWGPMWFAEGGACTATGNQPGCENHESDQFLVYAIGRGEFEACAAPNIPFEPEGSRCGQLRID